MRSDAIRAVRQPLIRAFTGWITDRFRHRRRWVLALLICPLVIVFLFAYVIPGFMLAGTAFLVTDGTGAIQPGITTGHFTKFFGDSWYTYTLLRSVRIELFVTVGTVCLGYIVAYFLSFYRPRLFEVYLVIIVAPVLVGNVVRAYGWRFLMGESGIFNTFMLKLGIIDKPLPFIYTEHGIIIADTSVLLPLIILILLGVLTRLDYTYVEAAKSLGANSFRAFWHVTLPLSLPGVGAASLICFTLAFGTFETAIFIGAGRVQMVAQLVYEQIGLVFNWPFGAAIALIILSVSVIGIIAHDQLIKENY